MRTDTHYLHTSPECAMKQLLASGSGDIYQIARVFRAGEVGPWHREEFLMLEWYRCHHTLPMLIQDTTDLIRHIGFSDTIKQWTYEEAFAIHCDINIHASVDEFESYAQAHRLSPPSDLTKNTWLHYLQSACLEPKLSVFPIVFITDFPAHEAALAQINPSTNTAKRVELYLSGIECGNGFQELSDPVEQRQRFENTNAARAANKQEILPIPEDLLKSLPSLPPCSGIAVGVERLFAARHKLNQLMQPGS